MLIATIVVALLTCATLFCVPQTALAEGNTLPSGTEDAAIGEAIDAFLAGKSANHAAVATAVFRGDEDVYTRYYGYIDEAGTISLDQDCVLEWGSTTKLTVWVSAMQLVDRGALDLNEDVRTYLPEGFLRNLRFDGPVTMLNLMNHNAGFQETDFVLEVEDAKDIIPLGEYLRTYQPLQVFAPGEVVAYSNWGAALAGFVVECIAGVPFWQYVGEHIFTPLGMTHSAIAADLSDNLWVQEKRKDFVSYLPDGTIAEDTKIYILPYPAGACTSTLSDFVRFAKALLTKDERLMSAGAYVKMYSASLNYTGTDTPRLCHGFLVDHEFANPIVGHDGNTAGGSSRLLLDFDQNVGMVVLTNQLGGSVYRSKMAELVFGVTEYHVHVEGHYIPMRGIVHGKSKFYSSFLSYQNCYFTNQLVDGLYVNVTEDRVEISASDYLLADGGYLARDALAIVWFILAGYALLNFVTRLVFAILDAKRKQPLDRGNLFSAVASLVIGLTVLTLEPAMSAAVAFAYMVVAALVGVAYMIYLIATIKAPRDTKMARLRYIQGWTIILPLVVAIVNAFVWDLIAFWL